MARLPNPGGDNGDWGSILNDYLLQALKTDGSIKDNAVTANTIAPNSITNAAIASDAVNAASIADGSITNALFADGTIQETKLDAAARAKLNAGASNPDWGLIANKPAVIAAGSTQAIAKAALGLARNDVGLGNVDNTSDATKNAAVATLTNKSLVNPKINQIYDANGNIQVDLVSIPSAVNHIYATNQSTGNFPTLGVDGSDSDIGIAFATKGNGPVRLFAGAGRTPTIDVAGGDTDIDLNLKSKGSGQVKINGSPVPVDTDVVHKSGGETISGSKAFTNPIGTKEIVITPTNGAGNTANVQLDNMNGQVWLNANNAGGTFTVYDNTNSKTPFAIQPGTPDNALQIGLGSNTMSQTLDMQNNSVQGAASLVDSNGVQILGLGGVGSATNSLSMSNSATGTAPSLSATGSDTNVSINLIPKGTGNVQLNGVNIPTVSSTDTLTNKSLSNPKISAIRDVNNNTVLSLSANAATTVNYMEVESSDTGLAPTLAALGSDTNIGMVFAPKGSGTVSMYMGAGQSAAAFRAIGVATDVDLNLRSQGAGTVQANGVPIATTTSTQTFTNKTLTSPVINGSITGTGIATTATASTIASRDASANISADAFIPSTTSTATAAATTTLTANSTEVQIFTGTSAQTIVLPTTNIVAGQRYTIISQTTQSLTVQSSNLATISGIDGSATCTFTALISTPTTAAHWFAAKSSSFTTRAIATASTVALRDANANLVSDAFIPGLTSTVTAAGTTTLTVDSTEVQVFTGSTTQVVTLPTTSIVAGQSFTITNQSTGQLTVNASGGGLVKTVGSTHNAKFVALQSTPTTAAHWTVLYFASFAPQAVTGTFTIPVRDGQANLSADAFIPSLTSTSTAGATTTLTVDDTEVQVFSGVTTQTVVLPSTSIAAGQRYTIVNTSTGIVTVNSSGGNLVSTVAALSSTIVTALQATPTAAAHWAIVSVSTTAATSTGAVSNSIAQRNASANLQADVFIPSLASTATAGATTTLTVDSTEIQVFTGSTTQIVILPTTGVTSGHGLKLVNQSSGALTVNASAGSTLCIIEAKATLMIYANIATPTLPTHWSIVGGSSFMAQLPDPSSMWAAGNAEAYSRQGLGSSTIGTQTATFTYFTAPIANTITKLAVATNGSGASSGITLARIGLYTVAVNGDLTLVARTANDTTIGSASDTLSQPALSTVGGYPASYTFIPGQRYAMAILQVGTTPSALIGNAPFSSGIFSATPQVNGRVFSQSDLAASYTAATVGTYYWTPWIAGIQ